MAMIVDIHPHIVADDKLKYPHNPMHRVESSHWTLTHPVTIEALVSVMDRAGVAKAALVQAASCYSFDNRYLCDSLAHFPGRFTGVAFVDALQSDALEEVRRLMTMGISGLRLFTATRSGSFDLGLLSDPRPLAVWGLCAESGLSVALQANPSSLDQVAAFAKRFPKLKLILDHSAHPDLSDGPPYKKASTLFDLAPLNNIFLKLTPRIFQESQKNKATPETLFPLMVEVFGSDRLAWGSNFPASEGDYQANLEEAKTCLSILSEEDQKWILGETALTLYPALKD